MAVDRRLSSLAEALFGFSSAAPPVLEGVLDAPSLPSSRTPRTTPRPRTSFNSFSDEFYLPPPPGDTYEWGYPCTVAKLPLAAPANQRYLPNAGGLAWGSVPNLYPYQCGSTIVQLSSSGGIGDANANAGADFSGKPEFVWLEDKGINCTAVPAPHGFLSRATSRAGGLSAQWLEQRQLRAAKERTGAEIMGDEFADQNTKHRVDNEYYAFAGVLLGEGDGASKRPVLKVPKQGFGNDILWKKKPTFWSKIKSFASGLNPMNFGSGDEQSMAGGEDWWPNIYSKHQAAFMCDQEKDCAYFVLDHKKQRMQMCQGQELVPKEGQTGKKRGKVFGYLLAKKMRGFTMGVKPEFLRQVLNLDDHAKILPNQKALCPGRDGRFLETRPFAEDLRDGFKNNARSPDVLRPTHWWYDLRGSKTFYMQPSDVRGELCGGAPTLAPQEGAFAVLPKLPDEAEDPMI